MVINDSSEKVSLGFLWSYKDTQCVGNTFIVKTVSGINSAKQGYPQEHENKKDFSCVEILEGDASRLSADKEEFLSLVQESLLNLHDSAYYKQEYIEYSKEYPGQISYTAFIAYKSAQLAQMHLAFSRLRLPHIWVQEYLSEFEEFKDENAYFVCTKLDSDRYEKQIQQALA